MDKKMRMHLLNHLRHVKSRCNNPNSPDFKWYGARGIDLCDEWKNDKESFVNWAIENGYEYGLTLERININKGYSPNNCKWVPMSEQPKNTRRNVFIDYKGESLIISEVARRENITCEGVRKRIKLGWYKRVPNPNCI